jgi:hypothetical protein
MVFLPYLNGCEPLYLYCFCFCTNTGITTEVCTRYLVLELEVCVGVGVVLSCVGVGVVLSCLILILLALYCLVLSCQMIPMHDRLINGKQVAL